MKSKLLINTLVATELILELVAIKPHTRPCLIGSKPTRIMFAIDGQPADLANTVKKYNAKKAILVDRVPKMAVVIAARLMAQINILLPPNLSARMPVVSFPVKFPAVPQPSKAPNVAVSRVS